MSQQYTYRDPTLSLWQSAVAQVQRNRKSVQSRLAPATTVNFAVTKLPVEDVLMAPVHLLGKPLADGQSISPETLTSPQASPASPAALASAGVDVDCAKVAAQFLWAEITGDKEKSDLYAAELKYATCDALGWAECLTAYLAFKASCGTLPYRPNQNIVKDLPGKGKIAIIGDWGTGDKVAINLLNQIASFKPDILLHVGDVYYSGTQGEANDNFLAICRQILGSIPLYSLCGNHDMYSGGDGYYWLIDHIGQQSSYFCLQNDYWQFLAMDTGHNDHDPLTVATNMTSLVNIPGWSEANWHLNKIQQAGNRRIALFSHHQLFSPFASVGNVGTRQYAYNPYLFSNFQSVLSKVDIWFWGHEHTLALYDPYMGLARGRCVGASAVPVFTDQQQYAPATGLETYQKVQLPTWNPSAILGSNGTDYNNAFAIMTLNNATATVNYYQVPLLQGASPLPFTDRIE